MAKKSKSKTTAPKPVIRNGRMVPARATATRSSVAGAVKIEIEFQPQDVLRITDQIVNSYLGTGRRR